MARPLRRAATALLISTSIALAGVTVADAAPRLSPSAPPAPPATPTASAAPVQPTAIDAQGNPTPVQAPSGLVGEGSGSTESTFAPTRRLSTSPDSVIGTDSRVRVTATTSAPNRFIVHITRGGAAHCTGWMVSPDTLVTAGHCVYNLSSGSWFNGLTFTPARNTSTAPYGSATAVRTVADSRYVNQGDTSQDWAIIKLSSRLGDQTGWFGLTWQAADYDGTSATVRGYPGDKAFGTLWTMSGPIADSTPNGLCYSMDTMGGQSGAPVYNARNQVIGIHVMGTGAHGQNGCGTRYNAATRITESLYTMITSEIG